jgi:Flp pilus assembly protein CpaB
MKTIIAAVLLAVSAAAVRAVEPASVPAGYRAVTIPLSGHRLAFIRKGDHVDVLVTFEAVVADKSKEKVTATILQYVLVSNVQKPAKLEDMGAVELIVNPNESQYTALALHQGELDLAVRPESDKKLDPMEMASFRKLFR